jgi:hypothetical protein
MEDEELQEKINTLYGRMNGYSNLGRVGRSFLTNVALQGLLE